MILTGDESVAAPENHLSEIYLTVLKNSIHQYYTEQEKGDLYNTLREILGTIVTLSSPLSVNALTRLLYIPNQDIDLTLEDLHAILDIPEDRTLPLRLHYPLFRDFLLRKERCCDSHFQVDERQAHQSIATNCIRLMSNCLKQDICGQELPGILVADVEGSQMEQCLPPEVRYACLYWIQHLQKSEAQLCDNDEVHIFLQAHLLHWLEALGWMQNISEGVLAIASLESIALVSIITAYYDIDETYSLRQASVPSYML